MAADVFPHFVAPDEESVRNPDVWEMARLFAVGHLRGEEGFNRRGESAVWRSSKRRSSAGFAGSLA